MALACVTTLRAIALALVTTLRVVTHRWTLCVRASGVNAALWAKGDSASGPQSGPTSRSHAERGNEHHAEHAERGNEHHAERAERGNEQQPLPDRYDRANRHEPSAPLTMGIPWRIEM